MKYDSIWPDWSCWMFVFVGKVSRVHHFTWLLLWFLDWSPFSDWNTWTRQCSMSDMIGVMSYSDIWICNMFMMYIYILYYIHLLMLGRSGLFLPLATTTNDCVASCYSYCYSYSVCYPYYCGYKYYYYSYYQHHHPFFNVLHLLLPPLFDFLPVFRFLCIQIVFWPMHYYNRCWR